MAKRTLVELHDQVDTLTGELFQSRAANHFEQNDGVPVAPHVDMPRPSVRQRVENLLNRGIDPLAHYVGSEDYNMEVPDDPDAPLTPSEMNYIEAIAADLAEQAPLPDEGLPRPSSPSPEAPQAPQPQVSSPAAGPESTQPATAGSTVPSR